MGDTMLSLVSVRTDDMYGYDKNCDPCQKRGEAKEAIGFCQDCDEYLCEKCFDVHCIPTPSADHTTVPLPTDHAHLNLPGSPSRGQPPDQSDSEPDTITDTCTEACPKHEGKVVEFYCEKHSHFGCRECIRFHTMCRGSVYIPDEAQTLKTLEVQAVLEEVDTFGKSAEQMFRSAQQIKSLTEQNCAKVIKQAQQYMQEQVDQLQRLLEDITDLAETKKQENLACLSQAAEKYSEASTQCMELGSVMEALQNNNQNCQLFVYMRKAQELLKTLQEGLNEIQGDNRTTLFKFKPNRSLINGDVPLGTLKEKESVGHWSSPINKHESVYIRSGKGKQTRVARRKSQRVTGKAAAAFQDPTDTELHTICEAFEGIS